MITEHDITGFIRPRILVVGDIMLDHYRIANATRISPEAPVPVLLNSESEFRLGGAGAVAAMCAALEAEVVLIGVVGEDNAGNGVLSAVEKLGITFAGVMSPARRTTVKERICAVASGRHRQQLCRIDHEDTTDLSPATAREVSTFIESIESDPPAAIILADYAKGFCVDRIVQACRNTQVPVFVDPAKGVDWQKYYGVECLVPNREEANGKTARDLCRQHGTTAAVVKLDVDGCELYSHDKVWHHSLASRTRVVHDVTGAGDQFIAALTLGRCLGMNWMQSATLGNLAAGLQVERHGCVPVTDKELLTEARKFDNALYLNSARNVVPCEPVAPTAV